mmetsp:Transcript_22372/g.43589  ORF Transcript_22372/g.43589 Transcript_22372/m.43589 type:complete len:546 (+) Transcript_22372:483-2120(+)
MVLKVRRAIVDTVLHHDPGAILVVVLLYLLHGDAILNPLLCGGDELAGRCRQILLGVGGTLLRGAHAHHGVVVPHRSRGPVGRQAGATGGALRGGRGLELASILGHPAARLVARLRRMLEPDSGAVLKLVDLDAEEAVVHHAHDIPGEEHRLHVLVRVHGTAADLGAAVEPGGVDLGLPVGPAPVLVRAPRLRDGVLRPHEISDLPGLAPVERDLRPDDLQASAHISVATDLHGLGRTWPVCPEEGVVLRLEHGGVDVDVVDDILGLVPPALLVRQLCVHVGRQHAVVEEVVVTFARRVRHLHLAQPLDHAPTDDAGQQRAQRRAVIRSQPLTVLLEGQQGFTLFVQGPAHVDGGAILAVFAGGQLALRAGKVHMAVLLADLRHTKRREDVAEAHARPDAVANSGAAPVEADSFLRHVLLFAAVASADEGHWEAHDGAIPARHKVVHADLHISPRHPRDLELMGFPVQLWHSPVVADHVQGGRGDPSGLLQALQRGLRVEGVPAREANHVLVALDPRIGRVGIALVHDLRVLPRRHLEVGVRHPR